MKNVRFAGALLATLALSAAAQTEAPQMETPQIDMGAPPPPPSLLLTRSGWEAGLQASRYEYEEPNLPENSLNGGGVTSVKLTGNRGGAVGAYTFTNAQRWFTRIDLRVSYGSLKYEGTGTQYGEKDWITEGRVAAGRDFLLGSSVSLSPYLGLGFRYLYNDGRGTATFNGKTYHGYERYSSYVYAPIGITMRLRGGERWVFAPTLEYDAFIQGRQVSKLSDAGVVQVGSFVGTLPDAVNNQSNGYGYRAYLMFESDRWAFGPWLHYWSIKDSEVAEVTPNLGFREPANWTREYGVELRYHF
jgi:hypothetical protein